ncbi:MAG: FAD-dependent oxidoreductase [Halovenus sp.]
MHDATAASELPGSTNVVVVGSGIGGLATAVTLAEKSVDVVVVEKSDYIGGSSGISAGQLWVPDSYLARSAGIEDSVETAVDYLTNAAGTLYEQPAEARHFVASAGEAVEYFADTIDLSLQLILGLPDYFYPDEHAKPEGRYLEPKPFAAGERLGELNDRIPHSPQLPGGMTSTEMTEWGGSFALEDWNWDLIESRRAEDVRTMGAALVGSFLEACLDRGVDVHVSTEVTELVERDGRIAGVVVERDGDEATVEATEGVVLNTGSYDWNQRMVEELKQLPDEHAASVAVPSTTGDGLRMAGLEGARVATYPPIAGASTFMLKIPGEHFQGSQLYRYCYNVGLPRTVVVDSSGERFCDESFYPEHKKELHDPTGEFPHLPCWLVFDDDYLDDYPIGNTKPGGEVNPDLLAAKSDTLAGLAEELSIPAEAFVSQVRQFNENARRGEDPEFGRGTRPWAHVWAGDPSHEPNPNLGPIETGPFYAVRLYVGFSSMSTVGLVTTDHGQVRNWNDDPIDGLYATGSVCAPVEWGIGYQSGVQNARSLAYGYLIGQHMAHEGQP